jgi:hypothetical protein
MRIWVLSRPRSTSRPTTCSRTHRNGLPGVPLRPRLERHRTTHYRHHRRHRRNPLLPTPRRMPSRTHCRHHGTVRYLHLAHNEWDPGDTGCTKACFWTVIRPPGVVANACIWSYTQVVAAPMPHTGSSWLEAVCQVPNWASRSTVAMRSRSTWRSRSRSPGRGRWAKSGVGVGVLLLLRSGIVTAVAADADRKARRLEPARPRGLFSIPESILDPARCPQTYAYAFRLGHAATMALPRPLPTPDQESRVREISDRTRSRKTHAQRHERAFLGVPATPAPGACVEPVCGAGGADDRCPIGRSSWMEVDMRTSAKAATARARSRFLRSVRSRFDGRQTGQAPPRAHRPRPQHPPATESGATSRRRRIIGCIWVAAALVLLTGGLLILTVSYAHSQRALHAYERERRQLRSRLDRAGRSRRPAQP